MVRGLTENIIGWISYFSSLVKIVSIHLLFAHGHETHRRQSFILSPNSFLLRLHIPIAVAATFLGAAFFLGAGATSPAPAFSNLRYREQQSAQDERVKSIFLP